MDDILEKLKTILIETLVVEPEEVIASAKLDDDLGADSMDVVEIVMAIEDEFDIDIDDSELENVKTVQDLVDLVNRHTDGR